MPAPGKNESRDDFVSRCIPIVLEDGTAEDQDQAVAVCNSMWETAQEGKAVTFNCECLDCGHVMETDQHCADVACPECGGQMRRLERPGPGKMKKLIDIDGEQVALGDLIAAYKASKAVTKKEADGEHPAGHYLVVEDSEKPTTWHLRVRNAAAELDHRLMGAAWAALHGGYRGNTYEGPNKQEAIAKLKRLYEQEEMEVPEEKSVNLSESAREAEQAWRDQFALVHEVTPSMPKDDPGWVTAVFDDKVIVERGGRYYSYSYERTDDGIVFGKPVEVQIVYEPVKTHTTHTPFPLTEDAVVSIGGAVKALGDGRTEGWLVEFTDPSHPDLEADYFDQTTDYGPHTFSLAFYHHGADKTLGRRLLKSAAALDMRDEGVWMEHQLDLRDRYEAAIYRLVEQGKLGLSSGTAPHLIERERKGDVSHITRWYLGLDASYTPTPANWQSRVMPLKSYIKSVGSVALNVGDDSIPQETPTDQDAEPKDAEASGESVARRRGLGRIRTLMLQMRTSED